MIMLTIMSGQQLGAAEEAGWCRKLQGEVLKSSWNCVSVLCKEWLLNGEGRLVGVVGGGGAGRTVGMKSRR